MTVGLLGMAFKAEIDTRASLSYKLKHALQMCTKGSTPIRSSLLIRTFFTRPGGRAQRYPDLVHSTLRLCGGRPKGKTRRRRLGLSQERQCRVLRWRRALISPFRLL
jgi:hypothetical protein